MDEHEEKQLGRIYQLLARYSERERGGAPEVYRAMDILQEMLEPGKEWDRIQDFFSKR